MPTFDMDTTTTIDPFGEMPESDYLVVVDDMTYKLSKEGRPMVQVDFKVDGGDYIGRSLSTWLMLDDKPGTKFSYKIAWKRFKEALELPLSGSYDSDEKTIGGERVIGRACYAHVRPQKDNPERSQISRLIPESKFSDESQAF